MCSSDLSSRLMTRSVAGSVSKFSDIVLLFTRTVLSPVHFLLQTAFSTAAFECMVLRLCLVFLLLADSAVHLHRRRRCFVTLGAISPVFGPSVHADNGRTPHGNLLLLIAAAGRVHANRFGIPAYTQTWTPQIPTREPRPLKYQGQVRDPAFLSRCSNGRNYCEH